MSRSKISRIGLLFFSLTTLVTISACNSSSVKRDAPAPPVSGSLKPDGHILKKPGPEEVLHQSSIPHISHSQITKLPTLKFKPVDLYSLSAVNVPVMELLFQISKDANLQIDIYSGVSGRATINALNEPLQNILQRLSAQSGFLYSVDSNTITIKPDIPQWRNYNVDYVNINKVSDDSIQMKMNVSSASDRPSGSLGGSSTNVSVKAEHNFWVRLKNNLEILAQLDPFDTHNTENIMRSARDSSFEVSAPGVVPRKEGAAAPRHKTFKSINTIINPEAGIVSVYTTNIKHKAIKKYIEDVSIRAQRQVLIEATVVEVLLNDRYQAGIDWSKFGGLSFTSDGTFTAVGQVGPSNILDQLSFLSTFGDSKVLSSPKIMAINNQTALLKVVNNLVYFTVDVSRTLATTTTDAIATYETEIHTVPVGFTMSVTPFVSEYGEVTLNIRPTISRKIGEIQDPNPELANIASVIPIIQEKEMSSVLRLKDRQTAIIGGLIEDTNSNERSGIPWLSNIPILGDLFSQRDDQTSKSELVIFIRPVIIHNADVDHGDLQHVGRFLKTRGY